MTSSRANALLVLVAGTALAIMYWGSWSPGLSGDGFEYLSMSEALLRHGTPDVRIDDLQEFMRKKPNDKSFAQFDSEVINLFRHGNGGGTFFLAGKSRFYSYHFWLYSLIDVPALAACQWLQIPLVSSFLLTNTLLFLGLIALIAFGTPWRFRRKFLLALLALGCGSTFYLSRSGPESMCFSLLLAGLLLLETRRFGYALFAFAVAAQQNPPIGFLAIVAGAIACWQALQQWRAESWNRQIAKRFLALIPGAIVLIASPVFYLIEFGTPNLIMKAGGSKASLISGYRLASLFFDLNQGMVLVMPGIFLSVAVLLAPDARNPKRSTWIAGALVLMMMLMALPALTAPNWNAGSAIITRYAYWLSAPLIYATALLLDSLLRPVVFVAWSIALVLIQIMVLGYFGIRGTAYSYVQMSPIATWLLHHHPSWYRPVPEIFVERGLHAENTFQDGYAYLYVRHGRLATVLSRNERVYAIAELCRIDPQKLHTSSTELHWKYWHLKHYCPLDWSDGFHAFPDPPLPLKMSQSNVMSLGSNYISPLLPGFGKPETWGTWTIQRFAVLPLVLPPDRSGHEVPKWRITLTFSSFVSPHVPMQHLTLLANGKQVLDVRITSGAIQTRSFVADTKPWVGAESAVLLEFRIPTAVSYQELGLNDDTRRMGIGLISVRADPL
ncbi:MAG: hypothetical protein ABI132_01655 [Rhodanobacteraceae bacterium]